MNFQENAIYGFNKYIFNRISDRVLWPQISRSPAQTVRDCIDSRDWRYRRVGLRVDFLWLLSYFSVLHLAGTSSTCHRQPQAAHKHCSIPSSFLCIWTFRAVEKDFASGKSLRQVRKKIITNVWLLFFPLQTMWNFMNFSFCLWDRKPKFILNPLLLD